MRSLYLAVLTCCLMQSSTSLLYAQCGTCATCCAGDMIFCLDASGSMQMVLNPDPTLPWNDSSNLMATPNHPCTRWSHVKEALLTVLSELSVIIQNAEDWFGTTNCPRCGWVSIVQFPAKATTPASYSEFHMCAVEMPAAALDKEQFFYHANPAMSPVRQQIELFAPRVGIPGTPMAHGLEASRGAFPGFPVPGFPVSGPACGGSILNHPPSRHGIFLFSDGENNVGGPIDMAWATAFNAATPASHDMKIYSIGFGDFPGVAVDALYNVAQATGGTFRYLSPAGYTPPPGCPTGSSSPVTGLGHNTVLDLAQLFKQQIIDEYWGITSMTDPVFTLNANEKKTFLICANELDSTLMVTVNTAHHPEARMPLVNILMPNGQTIDPHNYATTNGVQYLTQHRAHYFTFARQFIENNLGEWQVNLTAVDTGAYDFHAFIKSGLGFEMRNSNPVVGTGDKIHFEMTFAQGVVNADSLHVSLIRERPQIGVGSLFQKYRLNEKQKLNAMAQKENPDSSPANWKKLYLNQQNQAPPPLRDSITVVFNDLGKDGDKEQGDGIYSWQTDVIHVPDIYKFNFEVKGSTVSSGVFCRAKVFHNYVFVDVDPEWGASTIDFEPDGRIIEGQVFGKLFIRLADTYGNAVEPHLASYFDINISGGTLVGELEYDLDGAYVQKVSVDQGSRPTVDLAYRGKRFPRYAFPVPVISLKPWSFKLRYGWAFPLQDFEKLYKSGAAVFDLDAGYYFNGSPLAINLIGGASRFEEEKAGDQDNTVVNLNFMLRYHLWRERAMSPFIGVGPGYYIQKRSKNEPGASFEMGLAVAINATLFIDVASSMHYLFTDGRDSYNQTRVGFGVHF